MAILCKLLGQGSKNTIYPSFLVLVLSWISILLIPRLALAIPACTTWSAFSRNLPTRAEGRGGQWKNFGDLPPEFNNGCLLLDNNNSIDTAFILKQGIDPNQYTDRYPSNGNLLQFELQQELDQLVTQGKAFKITWFTPTIGSRDYLRSIPHDRAFLRNDGMTCLSTVCMRSGALTHQQLADILYNR